MSWDSEAEMFKTTTREDHERSLLDVRQRIHQNAILRDIAGERDHQDRKWGVQKHPDGTDDGCEAKNRADAARYVADTKVGRNELTWWDILREEVFEAGAEVDRTKLRAELVQVAAVCVAWVEDIDSRA